MKKKLNTILAATCLSLMLAPATLMAGDNAAAAAPDNAQATSQTAGNSDQSGNNQNAMPDNGSDSEEAAPSDTSPDDQGEVPEDSAPEEAPSAD